MNYRPHFKTLDGWHSDPAIFANIDDANAYALAQAERCLSIIDFNVRFTTRRANSSFHRIQPLES